MDARKIPRSRRNVIWKAMSQRASLPNYRRWPRCDDPQTSVTTATRAATLNAHWTA